MSDNLPAPAPAVTPETERFWDATAEGQLLLKECDDCESVFYYPRAHCPNCFCFDTKWIEAEGSGTIYAFTVTRKFGASGAGYEDATPFVLAYVELSEGPTILTNIVECDPESIKIGQPVEVAFYDTSEGMALPRFTPA